MKNINIKIVLKVAMILVIMFATYKTVRVYDNFVKNIDEKGYQRGVEETKKEMQLEELKNLTKKSN